MERQARLGKGADLSPATLFPSRVAVMPPLHIACGSFDQHQSLGADFR
jgi:hypothetical protein